MDHKKRGHYFWKKPAVEAATNAVPATLTTNAVGQSAGTNAPAP
jgi:hypothetical protein